MADAQIAIIDGDQTQVVLAPGENPAIVSSIPGPQGPAGAGVPLGGTTNQVLFKQSGTNYDTAWGPITSAMIGDLEIVNADVSASAAIAGTKISPNFGSQNVITTGTSTAASFIPTSSTAPTNGLYLSAANSVALSTGGNGRLFIDSSGNVGVGTASPASQVLGTTASRVIAVTGAAGGSVLVLQNDQGTVSTNARIELNGVSSGGNPRQISYIESLQTATSGAGALVFGTHSGAAVVAATERLRITSTGQLSHIGAGSSGSPAVSFNGSAPSNSLVVDSNGLIGAGTSSPAAEIHINSSSLSRLRFTGGAANATNFDLRQGVVGVSNSGVSLYDVSAAATRVVVDNQGRLGIGTSTPDTNLTVLGQDFNQAVIRGTAFGTSSQAVWISNITESLGTTIQSNASYSNSLQYNPTATASCGIHFGNGFLGFRVNAGLTSGTVFTPTERVRIDSSGRVGIGTTSPTSLLDVRATSGNVDTYIGVGDVSLARIRVGYQGTGFAGTADGGAVTTDSLGSVNLATRSGVANNIAFATSTGTGAATERARIDSSGRLGIGTTSPQGILDLTGTSRIVADVSGATPKFTGLNAAASAQVELALDGSALAFRTLGAEKARIDSSGRLGIGTSTPGATLDVQGSAYIGKTDSTYGTRIIAGSGSYAQQEFYNGATRQLFIHSRGDISYSRIVSDNWLLDLVTAAAQPILFTTNGNERARIDSSGRLLVGTSSARSNFFNSTFSPKVQFEGIASDNASLSITCNNTSDADSSVIALAKSSTASVGSNGAVVTDEALGSVQFLGNDGTEFVSAARIAAFVDTGTVSGSSMPGRLVFSTTADGAASPTERMRITSGGSVFIGNTGTLFGNTGTEIANSGTAAFSASSNYPLLINRQTTDGTIVEIRRGWQTVGTISVTTTATAYNTSSDYRLKENVVAVTDGITRLQQLKPSRFNFIADPTKTVDGFIAHEVQSVVPEAITGEKDAVDDDGNPVYQGIDQSKLVPLLTAALQEAIGRIETLEAEVAALKAS